eukprot:4539890-Prymnesium_polylepis.1
MHIDTFRSPPLSYIGVAPLQLIKTRRNAPLPIPPPYSQSTGWPPFRPCNPIPPTHTYGSLFRLDGCRVCVWGRE